MRLYFSGWQATNAKRELAIIEAKAIRHRCFSFAAVRKIPGLTCGKNINAALETCLAHKIPIMMDSGVFTYRLLKLSLLKKRKDISKLATEDQFIKLYVDFIKETGKQWDWYATVDLEKDAKSIYERHVKLEAMGIKPTPVFHGDASASDYLKRYHDLGHTFIAIGTATGRSGKKMQRHYLDEVFNLAEKLGLRYHGLAMTSATQLLGWPYYSADSSSWSRAAGYGSIFRFDEATHRMSTWHISDRSTKGGMAKLNPKLVEGIKEEVTTAGFDFDVMRQPEGEEPFVLRHIWNGKEMLRMIDYATKLHGQKSGNWDLLV